MGTLQDQPLRKYLRVTKTDIEQLLEEATTLSVDYEVSLADVLMAYRIKELERRNDLFVNNGDIFDEQMAGIGEILQEISHSLDNDK